MVNGFLKDTSSLRQKIKFKFFQVAFHFELSTVIKSYLCNLKS